MNSLSLDRFKVLLVGTKIPENIGSVARLLENYDVREGALVSPQCEWRTGVAQWMATGSSIERLNSLPVHSKLSEAISDCHSVVGFTARSGKTRKSSIKLEEISSKLQGRVALVFGREDFCLLSDEIEVCTHLCALDTSSHFPALNLSHSVAVVLSRLFNDENNSRRGHHEKASVADAEPMFEHLREMLVSLGYRGEGNPERVHSKLKKIFQRAGLTRSELDVLRGIYSKAISFASSNHKPDLDPGSDPSQE
jgi:TrmH family RNA methyltransferase